MNRAVDDTISARFGQIVNRHRQTPMLADIIVYRIGKKVSLPIRYRQNRRRYD
jgi:hypothetical protein